MAKRGYVEGDKAIRATEQVPFGYRVMIALSCEICHEMFKIVQLIPLADPDRAGRQSAEMIARLKEEHADREYSNHAPSYDLR